jgi:hypothetical protein
MSCYEWEFGQITLPTRQYASFRKEFIKGYNSIQLRQKHDKLTAWYRLAVLRAKGKRGFDYKKFMLDFCNSYAEEEMVEKLFTIDSNGKRKSKPVVPTKKMFNFVNTQEHCFNLQEAGITFDKTTHSVSWSVSENNHACESAHNLPEAKLLFRMLSNVKWVRGTGGVIVGNDEYNRDSYEDGGGSNYPKITFGNRK